MNDLRTIVNHLNQSHKLLQTKKMPSARNSCENHPICDLYQEWRIDEQDHTWSEVVDAYSAWHESQPDQRRETYLSSDSVGSFIVFYRSKRAF